MRGLPLILTAVFALLPALALAQAVPAARPAPGTPAQTQAMPELPVGIRTQSLAAGVPQVIMPMAHDQFDNAARIEHLGVGASIPRKRFTAGRAARVLGRLLASPDVAARCRACADRIRGTDALSRACDLAEQLCGAERALDHEGR